MAAQRARVLAALRMRGAHGVTQVDFLAPAVIDGHAPITRLAARVYELRRDGHEIIEEGVRNKCHVYRLLRDAQDARTAPTAPQPPASTLFAPPPRLAVFDEDAA